MNITFDGFCHSFLPNCKYLILYLVYLPLNLLLSQILFVGDLTNLSLRFGIQLLDKLLCFGL